MLLVLAKRPRPPFAKQPDGSVAVAAAAVASAAVAAAAVASAAVLGFIDFVLVVLPQGAAGWHSYANVGLTVWIDDLVPRVNILIQSRL